MSSRAPNCHPTGTFAGRTSSVIHQMQYRPRPCANSIPSSLTGLENLPITNRKFQSTTPSLKLVAQSPRRIPFHVRKQVSAKLEVLESLDIIEKVSSPTPWVSLLVVVPKSSGKIRVCVDMRRSIRRYYESGALFPQSRRAFKI